MHGIHTIERLNREADEAHRIIAAHDVGKQQPAAPTHHEQRENPHTVIDRILEGAKG